MPSTPLPGAGPGIRTLADYRDRWLVLFFYPRDFSLVCPTELTAMSTRIAEFTQRDCDILGVSTDSLETHERWIGTPPSLGGLGGLAFPLASDETGEVCGAYGVLVARQKVALRGLFVIDPNGVIQYQVVHNMSIGRSVDELLRVLEALQSGGMCPATWSPGAATIDLTQVLGPNRVVGSYRIESEIGRGAFGVVYRAWDTVLDRAVALKVLQINSASPTESLLGEARAAAALNHPHICTIHTIDASTGRPVIVMELIEGRPLSELLAEGPLPREDAARLARQIASGLAAAHAAGVVHGDLKPANILVRADGFAKLMDFGLARRALPAAKLDETMIESGPTGLSGLTGTPYYMSPEQTQGSPATPASDLFSLGLIVFELFANRRAVSGASLTEVLRSVNNLDVEALARDLPEPFANIVRRTLSRDAASRSAGLEELLRHPDAAH